MNVWRLKVHHLPEYYEEALRWTRRNGTIAIGWGGTGDLRLHSLSRQENLRDLVVRMKAAGSGSNQGNCIRSLWRLYDEMQIGDLVIVNTQKREMTMRVIGEYHYVSGEYPPFYEHRRTTEVLPINPDWLWQMSGGMAAGQSIYCTLIRCQKKVTESEIQRAYARR